MGAEGQPEKKDGRLASLRRRSAEAAGASVKTPEQKQVKGAPVSKACSAFLKCILSIDLFAYFALSCFLYLACGTTITVLVPGVEAFFCNIAAQEKGCDNCPDELMMCEKPTCWQNAVNLTYKKYAADSTQAFYQSYSKAALDTAANKFIQLSSVTDPLQLLSALHGNADVTVDSIEFHCQVLFVAIGKVEPGVLSGTGGPCTNDDGVKQAEVATECPCDDLEFTEADATEVDTWCSSLAPQLVSSGFASARSAGICSSGQAYYPSWCPTGAPTAAPTAAPTPAPAAAPTPAPTAAGGRRLPPEGYLQVPRRSEAVHHAGGEVEALAPEGPDRGDPDCLEAFPDGSCIRRLTAPTPSAPTPSGSSSSSSSSSSSASDAEGEAWEETDWSECTCLQQCTDGVRTRTVTCPMDDVSQCQEKPATMEACTCDHCAKCIGQNLLLTFNAIAYYVQGGLSLILFLAYLQVAKMQEDDLVDTGCVVKSMGCVAKNMPLMVRTFAYLTLLPQLLNLASVFLPIEFQAHCGTNTNLKFLTLLIFLVWVFQIVLGVSVKRARPLPPWLFQAQRKGLMSTLCYPVRVIGP